MLNTDHVSDDDARSTDISANLESVAETAKLITWAAEAEGGDGAYGYWRGPSNTPLHEAPIVQLDSEWQFSLTYGNSISEALCYECAAVDDDGTFEALVAAVRAHGVEITVERPEDLAEPGASPTPGELRDELYERLLDARASTGEPRVARSPNIKPRGVVLTGADLGGDAEYMLDQVGTTEAAERIAARLGLPDADDTTLRAAGVAILALGRGEGPHPASSITIFTARPGGVFPPVEAFAQPDTLFSRLSPAADAQEFRARLGEPISGDHVSLFYRWGDGDLWRLHVMFVQAGMRSIRIAPAELF